MCGICGKLTFSPGSRGDTSIARRMLDPIQHRGPDDEGSYCGRQITLGHRRLSIIDLSTGHQPLSNEDGSVWIVFNGEIYNYRQLRPCLIERGHTFRTESDTEVIVHLYEEMGPRCVEKLRGMFAFAIWDERQRSLLLARDRVGIKPLYYYKDSEFLAFGSEIKSIVALPEVKREVSPQMIDRFLTFYYVPGEETPLRNVCKLAPGHYLLAKDGKTEIHKYWDLDFSKRGEELSESETEKRLLNLLAESVDLHMISDVPVGFLLSGGVDSTAMLSLASANTSQPLSSYTVGFEGQGVIDERPFARLAATTFGTDHHEITISSREFVDFMPKYIWHMEEPVCEPPAIALFYVSKLASQYVKVLISGEGGDEAFAGYSTYRNISWFERLKPMLKALNPQWMPLLSGANSLVRSGRASKYLPLVDLPFEDYYYSRTSSPLHYFNSEFRTLYSQAFASQIDKPASLEPIRRCHATSREYGVVDRMLYIDSKTWLPDDLLVKADKMTMANSVELRVPLLDHVILEFAASLPVRHKVRGNTTKYIAKKALSSRVPKPILDRRKAGFPVPYESWLGNGMKSWVHDVLFDRRTLNRGYFNRSAVEDLLRRNQASGAYSKEVFSLLTLELWHREFLEARACESRDCQSTVNPSAVLS
ncbi:MAG: asparagine synthase (glutamine-hydrolyzing) [Candidatus Acidiferrales bacterium]